MSQHQDKRGKGIAPGPHLMHMLFVLFVGLKLTGHIAWSWWWVFAPLWGWALVTFAAGFTVGFVKAYRAVSSRKDKAESV